MRNNDFLQGFRDWSESRQSALDEFNITVSLLGQTQDHTPNSLHVELLSGRHETTVQLWEDGLSDFHFLDWDAAERDPNVGVVVTHYEFQNEGELFRALDELINLMSPTQNTFVEAFTEWLKANQSLLDAYGVTVRPPERTLKNTVYTELKSDFGEATIELWSNGVSDFHIPGLNTGDARLIHHEFQNVGEMFRRVKQLVERLGEQSLSRRPEPEVVL